MIKFLVKQQKIETLEREVIASNQIAFVNIRFVFDGDWKKFHKVVQFTQCDETYNRVLGYDGTSCLLPSELHEGTVKMSVFGYDTENTAGLRATTVPVTLHIRPSGFVGDDVDIPPTPDLYAQLLKEIESAGHNGKSAYEIAVDHGYIGTEEEWLESLKAISDLSDYVTKEQLNDTELSIRESMIPLQRELHSHSNLSILNEVTAPFTTADKEKLDGLSVVSDFLQFMDSTKYEIQTLTEEIGNFSRTAHTHSNQEILDSITDEKIAQWNSDYALQYDLDSLAENVKVEFQKVNRSVHQHSNKSILDSITSDKLTSWDKAVVLSADVPTLKSRLNLLEQQIEAGLSEIVEV